GKQETVVLNTKLTAAEVVAVQQVLTGAGQTIKIGANGAASGGQIVLNNSLLTAIDSSIGSNLSSLTVARGVQVVDSLSSFSLSGSLTNYGSILTAAGAAGATDTIYAGSVLNARSASIGSYTTSGALYGADLSLNAANSVTNNGSISSASILNISAPAVFNVSFPGANASLSAGGNVNINTAALTNTGTVASTSGNVNVASTGALALNGAGGTLQALTGNVNFASSNADITVNGGNVLSQQVNFNAGTGTVNATMDEVSGLVNANACNVHVTGSTADLRLGAIDASGDPLFVNTAGNIDLSADTSIKGAPYTAIASGNITTSVATTIDTSSTTANGGAVTLIAGATVSQPAGAGTPATVTKASATGGTIDLTGVTSIKTGSSFAGGSGGNIQLIAYAGKNAGSGEVISNSTSIDTSATGTAVTAGNVTIIAGAKTGTAIQTGSITATAPAGPTAGGTITVYASTPAITVTTKGQAGVQFDGTGVQTANVFAPSKTPNAAGIVMGNVNTSGVLDVSTGASASVANTTSALSLGTIVVGKTGTFTASDNAGAISLTGTITGGTSTITATGANAITATAAGASINTTNLNLNVGTLAANVTTDVANLVFSSAGGDVNVTQTTAKNSPLALNLSSTPTKGATTGDLTVNSTGQINVVGLTQVAGNTINLNATGKGGIAINSLLAAGTPANSQINLNNVGSGKLTETKGNLVSANIVAINSATSFGSQTTPFLTAETGTGAELILISPGVKNSSYITDSSAVAVSFFGNPFLAPTGGSLFLTSTSPTLTVRSANYTNVSLADTSTSAGAGGIVMDGSLGPLGNAAGTFTATSSTGISGAGTIVGKTVTLNGLTGISVTTATPTLTLTALNGNAIANDSLAVTVNGTASQSSANAIVITDNGAGDAKTGASITVGKSLAAGNIILTTTGTGGILSSGAVGNASTASVLLNSATFVTTKGAINGASINLAAHGGNLTVGGAVGGLGSTVILTTSDVTPSLNTLTVAGVLSGKTIIVNSAGQIVTTKAINGLDANSLVIITGKGTATTNSITVGAAITGQTVIVGNSNLGNIAINANVGLLASTNLVVVQAGQPGVANTGSISGRGVVAGQNLELESDTAIGTSKQVINTQAANLLINVLGGNKAPAFIAQKGNLNLQTANSSALTMKVTGALNITGAVNSPALALTSTAGTSLSGVITDGGTPGTISLTSGAGLTTYIGSTINATATTPVTLKVTGAATLNGAVNVGTLNLSSTGLLTIGTTGDFNNVTDNITSSGGIVVAGTLGHGADVLNVTTTGALQIGFPNQTATISGTGTITGASITNYGSSLGNITYTATGAGTTTVSSFSNYGTIGNAGNTDTIVINASKGTIYSSPVGTIDAANLSLTAGANATINLSGNNLTDLTGATVKGAFTVGAGTGDLTFGSAAVGSVTTGSLNLIFANGSSTNANTLTVNSVAAKTGDLTVNSNARNLDIGAAANLTTLAGNINLQNTNTNAAANITVGNNVIIHGSGAKTNLNQGNVSIFMGAAGYTPTKGVAPANAVLAGTTPAQIFFGSTANLFGSITSGVSTLNSSGRNLSFNTGTFGSGAIVLGTGDTITADPPVDAVPTINVQNAVIGPAVTAANAALTISTAPLANSAAFSTPVFNPSVVTATINSQNTAQALTPGFLGSNATIDTSEAILDGVGTGIFGTNKVSNIVKDGVKAPLTGSVSNAGHMTLERGPLLLSPEHDTVVETPFGNVSVSANSMALIIASANGLSVYNLHDAHKNAVVMSNGSTTVSLIPGRSAALVSTSIKSFEEANQVPFVPYRRVTGKDLANGKIYQAEFDLTTMVRGLPALKKLVASSDAKQRTSAGNVLKTAAILMQISAGGEPYALYLTPSLTACALSPDHNPTHN
ncbi:MAG: hypothetical protein KGS72_26510, partial [Cyanobacteria bacterium REEB67]|nr:hypothetical protein [Cyanobacteria bacterium REEB67]